MLDCGGAASFTEKFVFLGSLLHRDLTDKHGVDTRIKKTSQAFGALRDKIFSSASVSERLKGKLYAGGVLSVLLYGCESWCLTETSVSRLSFSALLGFFVQSEFLLRDWPVCVYSFCTCM